MYITSMLDQSPEMKFSMTMHNLREKEKKTSWWLFSEKMSLREEIRELEKLAIDIGISMALRDLSKAGIIKSI